MAVSNVYKYKQESISADMTSQGKNAIVVQSYGLSS